jgi:hypothetical protein
MKRIFITFLLVVTLAVPAAADEVVNFLKQGYGFFVADTSLGAVGLLEPLQTQNPPFDFDFVNFQVTWAIQDLLIDNYSEFGSLQIWDLVGGTIGIYEDGSFDLDYGVDPATGLATATNGVVALSGTFYSAGYLFNTISETGTFSGTFIFTGGSRFAELGPLGQFDWEIFDGTSANVAVNVPPGYHSRFAGRVFTNLIVPVEGSTMSALKALY